ncbi:Disease resistance protein [Melia azedarach]|uniref:Disease resistance protein n=1 Tax=Melia azedarach TaxID=155640 RepID=A0ACC1YMB1_MELAZ|nr:Disease resistance protein [Melia azedarach]
MVDALVSFVVQRLGDFLIQEAVFFREVRNEVKSLKKELEWMLCFVKDAEEKQVEDVMIRQWVSDIRDVAHDIENVLDNFMLTVDDEGEGEGEGEDQKRRSGFLASMNICSCVFDSNLYRKGQKNVGQYKIGKEIEDLRKRVADISRRRESYRLESIETKTEGKSNDPRGRLKELRRATSYAVEENVVGFDDDFTKLLARLLDKEPCRFVISIYGSLKIKVSTNRLEKMRAEDMERYLHKGLQGKSYLVVVDDVWHKEAWESLKRALPDNKNGSRVIITTRIRDVAERLDERTYAHDLRFLSPDESWKLFCSKAFRGADVNKALEKLGREMVEKCDGLPLAIAVLGGLLSAKKPQE